MIYNYKFKENNEDVFIIGNISKLENEFYKDYKILLNLDTKKIISENELLKNLKNILSKKELLKYIYDSGYILKNKNNENDIYNIYLFNILKKDIKELNNKYMVLQFLYEYIFKVLNYNNILYL